MRGSGGIRPHDLAGALRDGRSAVVVIANDFSAINVALPTMEKDFDTNINTIQWVINAYALTFGVMIVTGGRLADMFGGAAPSSSAPRSSPRCRRSAAPPRPRPG